MFIGVAGQAQMGKDTLADHLEESLKVGKQPFQKWHRDAFAGNVKRIYCETFGVDMDFVEEWKVNPEPPPGFDMNVRKSLQFIGDGFRQIKGSIWIDLMFRDLSKSKILSDVRYPNEFIRIKEEAASQGTRSMNILIARSDKLSDDPNGSEAMIKPYCEWALNNLRGNFVKIQDILVLDEYHDYPASFHYFDIFIRNDGTKEELYENIETNLVPYVQKYFQEESCPT